MGAFWGCSTPYGGVWGKLVPPWGCSGGCLAPYGGVWGDARPLGGVFGGHTSLILPYNCALPHPRAHLSHSPRVLQKIPPGPPPTKLLPQAPRRRPALLAALGLGWEASPPPHPFFFLSPFSPSQSQDRHPISHRIGHSDGEPPPSFFFPSKLFPDVPGDMGKRPHGVIAVPGVPWGAG